MVKIVELDQKYDQICDTNPCTAAHTVVEDEKILADVSPPTVRSINYF